MISFQRIVNWKEPGREMIFRERKPPAETRETVTAAPI